MEGQRIWENPLQFMPLSSGGDVNDVFNGSQGDMNQLDALSLRQWIYDQEGPQNYVEFLAENSIFLEKAPTTDILEGIPQSLDGTNVAPRDSKIGRELYNHPEKLLDLQLTDSPLSRDAWCTKPSPYVLKTDNPDGSINVKQYEHNVNSLEQYNEEKPRKEFASTGNQRQNQTRTSRRQQAKGEDSNFSRLLPRETSAVDSLKSKPRCSLKNQRATINDRQRRLRIAERIKALQDQLPHPTEECDQESILIVCFSYLQGSQASMLTDIIDHVKYLQLKLKELSRSRLGSEPTYAPFIFLEGYGHYVLHENMRNEPLEEMMGKLLEADPSLANLLLESRGLYVMPLAWAEGSTEAT